VSPASPDLMISRRYSGTRHHEERDDGVSWCRFLQAVDQLHEQLLARMSVHGDQPSTFEPGYRSRQRLPPQVIVDSELVEIDVQDGLIPTL
jgi:hypothetical protein